MLQANDLAFGFPGRTVGRDVSFSLAAGEVLCVLGPNGGGKTTLFRTLLGLLPPRAGSITLDKHALEQLSRREIARLAGYVPQEHAGYFAFTVGEFVLMGRTAHLGAFSAPRRTDREVAARALDALGISALSARPVTEISGGERQLALVARALAQEPKLLILDEPTAGLDFGNQVRVLQKISALAATGISILFSTHDPDHAFLAAHRALLLAQGHALEIGAPAAVIRADTLERLYGVSVQVLPLENGGHTCLPALRP
jgi:ABC-type cobalamin/Fe3+-siderophores transport system ATPase subunit